MHRATRSARWTLPRSPGYEVPCDWLTDPAPGPQHSSITSSKAAAGWETFFGSVDHVVTGRGTYEKALTFDEWPYDGKRVIGWAPVLIGDGLPLFGFLDQDIQLSLVASNASESGMVHATYAVHRNR